MKKIILLGYLLFLVGCNQASSQLISWNELVQGVLPQPTEQIQIGDSEYQFADLWLPDNPGPHPVILLIHGGCWLSMYPGVEIMNHMAEDLQQHGFAVWNIEYRRLGHDGGGYPGTFLDAAQGADHLRKVADTYNLDLNNLIASGHSAGGHLASWLAVRKNIATESPLYSENPIEIQTVISLAGINDLQRYGNYGASSCGRDTVSRLINLEERGDNGYSDTSPLQLLPSGASHIEINAAFDAPVPPFMGYHYVQAAKKAGDDVTHVLLPKAGHFEMIAPWSDEWKQVLEIFKEAK